MLVVIDGLISDKIELTIQEFVENTDVLVRQIRIKNAKGLWNARNEGIRSATSNFVALHDADDAMHPDRLRLQMNELNITVVDILCTPAWEFDVNSGEILNLRVCSEEMIDIHSMFWNSPINHSSVIAKRETLIEIGGYRNIYPSEDYDLWLQMAIDGELMSTGTYLI